MKYLPPRVRVTITVVAWSSKIFNRGLSPVFYGNLELIEVNFQPSKGVGAPDQRLYIACNLFYIQELVWCFNSCDGPRINTAYVEFAIYCAMYSKINQQRMG